MDVLQLRSWAEFMDKATIVALIVAVIAIVAAGTTTWLSIKYYRAVATQGSLDQYKLEVEAAGQVVDLKKDIAAARDRSTQLEQALAEANERAAENQKQNTKLETEVEAARTRNADLERELAAVKAHGEEGRTGTERSKASTEESSDRRRQMVESLRKFAGTTAALYAMDEAPDAAREGSSINALLAEAGWAVSLWKWSGVSGIVGVVVLTREGMDPAIDRAAAAAVEALGSAGFNAVKASWPTDANWRRVKGTFSGPQSSDPTEASVRIVIGTSAR